MNCLRPLLLATLTSTLFACQPAKESQPFVLTLAHMNDTHSQFDPSMPISPGRSLASRRKRTPSTPVLAATPGC